MDADFDLSQYKLPADRGSTGRLSKLYPVIPRNTEDVPFDIYDYEMLFNDAETLRIISSGDTIGCFYIESPGMRSLLKRLSVNTFEGLTAASSIIRPGVAESGMMQEYIARHKDPKRRKYLVKEMESVLGDTYGVMIYQEDVIKVAHAIVGLSLDEADLLRRAMSGKMRSKDAMLALGQRFYQAATAKGFTREIALELWRQIESFAGYAFCKAHSASFALLSFQVAFLKAHYTAEFMASVLSNGGGFYSSAVYIQECKRLGLTVLLPCINESEYDYIGKSNIIRIGLMAIKHLERASCNMIIDERKQNGKYSNLENFIARVRLGYEETSSLIRCGAMDCFRKTRPALMRFLDIFLKYRKVLNDNNSYNLFDNDFVYLEKELDTNVDYSDEEKCRIEYESFDYMVSHHPLEFYSTYLADKNIVSAVNLPNFRNRRVEMVGWYMSSKRIKTKKGEIMKFLSLEDLTGTFEAVIFPKAYERYAMLTSTMGPYIVTGRVDSDNSSNIIVDKLEVLSAVDLKADIQLDSVDNQYFGDVEKVTDDEFRLAEKLDTKKMIKAYAG